MKKLMASLLGTVLMALPANATDYFRHLTFRETPFAQHMGIHPISAAEARDIAHYRFDYDAEGRVTSIRHAIDGKNIANNGNWDSFTWFGPEVRIRYEGNQEIHEYYNTEGQRYATHGAVYSTVYELDSNGTRTSLRHFDENDTPVESTWGAHLYEWSTDDQGRIREVRTNLAGEQVRIRPNFEFFEVRLTYGPDGRVQQMENYGLDGKPTNNTSGAGIDRIYYDAQGNFVRWQVYDIDDNPVQGNAPNVHVGEHLYDKNGNKVGLRGFDKAGKRMTFAFGFRETSMDYDERGNALGMKHFAPDGTMFDHTMYERTPDGRYLSWIKAVGADGKPYGSMMMGGAAAIQLIRSPDNPLDVTRVFYNAQMEEYTPGSN